MSKGCEREVKKNEMKKRKERENVQSEDYKDNKKNRNESS